MHYADQRPSTITYEQTLDYLHYIKKTFNSSRVKIKMALQSFSFFFKNVLKQPFVIPQFANNAHVNKLPKLLTIEQVGTIIDSIKNIKHRTIIALAYCTGLRISELSKLKIADIDGKQMCIHVLSGKGKKDRNVALPESMLEQLRSYYLEYKPELYLFSGQKKGTCYSIRSMQLIFKTALEKNDLNKPGISFHSLRHSYATHMVELGADIQAIQHLLGHHHLSQTTQYLHLSSKRFLALPNPYDELVKNKKNDKQR
jgi:site-specific recombinase XerD